jgi:hypothetical protein
MGIHPSFTILQKRIISFAFKHDTVNTGNIPLESTVKRASADVLLD